VGDCGFSILSLPLLSLDDNDDALSRGDSALGFLIANPNIGPSYISIVTNSTTYSGIWAKPLIVNRPFANAALWLLQTQTR
jgi:hypothetical protein